MEKHGEISINVVNYHPHQNLIFMKPEDVKPEKWLTIEVIFNDDVDQGYAVIWGEYKEEWMNESKWALATRWNGLEQESGSPLQDEQPVWHREPHYLTLPILEKLLTLSRSREEWFQYTGKIKWAMKEFLEKGEDLNVLQEQYAQHYN